MICNNCRKPVKTNATGMPYCGCRIYSNSKPLSYVLIKTINRKILIKETLWVIAQGGTVGLVNNSIEVYLRREAGGIYARVNGEQLGRVEYISLPPFVEKLLKTEFRRETKKHVMVIARRSEAAQVLSVPGATLRGVENGKATISIPL